MILKRSYFKNKEIIKNITYYRCYSANCNKDFTGFVHKWPQHNRVNQINTISWVSQLDQGKNFCCFIKNPASGCEIVTKKSSHGLPEPASRAWKKPRERGLQANIRFKLIFSWVKARQAFKSGTICSCQTRMRTLGNSNFFNYLLNKSQTVSMKISKSFQEKGSLKTI